MTSGRSSATPRQRRGTHWPGWGCSNIDTTTTTTQLKSEMGGDRLLLHVHVVSVGGRGKGCDQQTKATTHLFAQRTVACCFAWFLFVLVGEV